jgi:hypothetical protein
VSEVSIQYESPESLNRKLSKPIEPSMRINAFTIQEIVYEVITGFMASPDNDPAEMGYKFTSRYHPDETKSDIHIALAYDWKAVTASKIPAVYIQRGDMETKHPTIRQTTSYAGIKESEEERTVINIVPIQVVVIAKPFAVAEQIADWIRVGLVSFQPEIQGDFNLRRFRVESMSAPKIYVEGENSFVIMLNINAVFDEGWILKRDDLKLKAVGSVIFDKLTSRPLERI